MTATANHVTWYRRYRPQCFGDIAGQEQITKGLATAVAHGTVSHAYLFTGPKGTGKTTTARVLYKAINCLQSRRGEPCGSCDQCKLFAADRAYDLLELDAASHNGIDAMRSLCNKVGYSTQHAKRRVVILDEAHRITPQAWDAFLKTLEEPPAQNTFILCTTESARLPETVLSRCQIHRFNPVSVKDGITALRRIADAETVEVNDESLKIILQRSGGSLRGAVVLLEQLAMSGEGRVDPEAPGLLPMGWQQNVALGFVQHLAGRKLGGLLTIISKSAERGYEAKLLARDVSVVLSNLLWLKAGVVPARGIHADQRAGLAPLIKLVPLPTIALWLRSIAAVAKDNEAWDSTLPLELALIECLADDLRDTG